MAKNEEQYWRGEKRRDQGSSEEEEGAMNPKRVRGEWTGDKNDDKGDESLINTIQTRDLTADKGAVSQLHSRKKVVPKNEVWNLGNHEILVEDTVDPLLVHSHL